ncbi:MAG: NAD-dependent protein deacylase, partial [Candidatus Cloacimonetes bacterium]|nr:NAD-dependent protein deacylase [Candidatus Cloacimonadota bacterium]
MNDFIFSKTDKIIVLTGAGISAESGIKTFRDSNGLWENHKVEDVATPQAFKKNPVLVWNFYKQRYYQSLKAQPNNGHKALIELEMKLQDNFTLITQNVDNLHSKAGSKNIIEMHGSLNKCFCIKCQTRYSVSDINLEREIPLCPNCNNYLRPDIVWFGEIPYNLDLIEQKLKKVT